MGSGSAGQKTLPVFVRSLRSLTHAIFSVGASPPLLARGLRPLATGGSRKVGGVTFRLRRFSHGDFFVGSVTRSSRVGHPWGCLRRLATSAIVPLPARPSAAALSTSCTLPLSQRPYQPLSVQLSRARGFWPPLALVGLAVLRVSPAASGLPPAFFIYGYGF